MKTEAYTNSHIEFDMALATALLKDFNLQSAEDLELISGSSIDEGKEVLTIVFPKWLIALQEAFYRIHGESEGAESIISVVQILVDNWVKDNLLTKEFAGIFMTLLTVEFQPESAARSNQEGVAHER